MQVKQYKILLWDIDGTLLDFAGAEQKGIRTVFKNHGMAISDKELKRYQKINMKLWTDYEKGIIKKEEIFNNRFQLLLDEMGMRERGADFEREYRMELDANHDLIPGALQICEELYRDYTMYVVTNGLAATQYRRLQESGLDRFFADIFISEEAGCQKPDIKFFHYCFKRMKSRELSSMLIIGDSLSSDMQGGINAGIDTCWYNPEGQINRSELPITYTIKSYEELKKIIIR